MAWKKIHITGGKTKIRDHLENPNANGKAVK
jgi:hypothetical protein